MSLITAGILLVKVTLLFAVALCALPLMRRSVAAMRHLLCASALGGALLLPFALLIEPRTAAIRIPLVFLSTTTYGSAARTAKPISTLIFSLWALGTIFLALRIAIGYRRIARTLREAKLIGEAFGQTLPGQALPGQTSPGQTCPAAVYSADVSVPLITGLLRPVILMPRSAESWPLSQREAALKHELSHLKRKDLWTSLTAHLACAAYWFHPLAWMLARRLRHEQELACDDAVLHAGFEAASYAEALVAAARYVTKTPMIGCPMITRTNETSLKSRIARLLDHSLPRSSSPATLRRTALVFTGALITIGMLNAGPQAQGSKETPATDEHVYKVGDGVSPPSVIYKTQPEYTEEARAAKIAGTVLLTVIIKPDGLAHDINIVSAVDQGLGVKAVEAVQQWRFKPGALNGEPVAVMAQIEVNFKLR